MLKRSVPIRCAFLVGWLALLLAASFLAAPIGRGASPPALSVEQMKRQIWEDRAPPALPSAPSSDAAAGTDPASTPEWERVIVQSFIAGNFDLTYTDMMGNREQRLALSPADETDPNLNSDGTEVVYVSNFDGNNELYRVVIDGGTPTRLTTSEASDVDPWWSPDDQRIVFASDRNGNYDLFLIDRDGGSESQLTSDAAHDVMPSWSPDGRYIAWVRIGDDGTGTLWEHDLHTQHRRPLTAPLRFLQNPAWAPHGAQISIDCDCDGDLWNELAIVNRDGPTTWIVYNPWDTTRLTDAWNGSWSHDGRQLLFTEVIYRVSGNRLVIIAADAHRVPVNYDRSFPITARDFEFAPHTRSLDASAPVVDLAPYDRYMRGETIAVRPEGEDVGPAGIDWIEITIWDAPGSSVRRRTRPGIDDPVVRLPGDPGKSYSISVRATDHAENYTDWLSGPHPITLYSWMADGSVRDARGVPVVDATLHLGPTPPAVSVASALDGRYRLLASWRAAWRNEVWAEHPGYGTATRRVYQSPADEDAVDYTLRLPPLSSFITNGSVEQGTTGWGTIGQVVAASHGFAGDGAFQFGPGGGTLGLVHAITQSVSIPATTHAPTLSFEYMQGAAASGDSGILEVLVDGVPRWANNSASGGRWQHGWLDMDAWKGQRVELAFRLTEPAVGGAAAWLDEVSLGEWRTPVVAAVEGTVTPGSASSITIRGENFDPAAEVLLDDSSLTGIQWVDGGTLEVTIPPRSPGYYRLIVRNPGHTRGGIMLPVGAPVFVPTIVH